MMGAASAPGASDGASDGASGAVPDASMAPWPQYARAVVELVLDGQHLVLTPGRTPNDTLDPSSGPDPLRAFVPPIWVLTASDPYPLELGASENAARLRRLCVELDALGARGARHDPALGRSEDGSVSELSRAVRGADRATVCTIAARHGQLAVYEIAQRIDCIAAATATVVTSRAFRVRSAPVGDEAPVGPTGWRG